MKAWSNFPIRLRFFQCCLFLLIASMPFAQGGVVISEFLSVNSGGLHDQDGASSDWIEIHNDSASPVNLAGWHLTDTVGNPIKWTFPATNLPAGGYLVVFASGKNRAVAGGELHANFQLSREGNYLALVMPDGVTVASEFSPAYPRQRMNVSYGVVPQTSVTPLISSGAAARVLVPSNSTLGFTWTARTFNDSTWAATNTPVGFIVGTVSNSLLAVDINERGQDAAAIAATTQTNFSSFVINSNGGSGNIQTEATTRVFGGLTVTISNTAPYGYDDRLRSTPVNSGAFTDSLLLRDFIFATDNTSTGGLDVAISGLTTNRPHRLTVWSFDSGSSGGNHMSDWSANGVTVTNGYSFNGGTTPTANEERRITFDSTSDGSGKIVVSGRRNLGGIGFGVFLNALQVSSLTSIPATNGLALLMLSNNATAYVRIPFTVANSNAFQVFKLAIRYNDGFVAYVNGQLVASRNAPGSPQWNSAATTAHSDTGIYEDIYFTNSPGLLVNGANVLAIHGLNVSASDPDFLVLPQLDGIVVGAYISRYFSPPTPAADNDAGYPDFVEDTTFSVPRGFYDVPFTVALTTATANASIYWTTNGSAPAPTNGTLYSGPVNVSGTTLLRAAAFFTNYLPSISVTHTYLFLNQIFEQPDAPPGFPATWQGSYPADYAVDPFIVAHTNYGVTLSNDLRAIPTISIVTDHDNFWNPSTGIYVNATQTGEFWERPASAELFEGNNTSDFQLNCSVQMQGNASRDNARTPKHSLRLQFRSDFGPGKLTYDWFTNSPVSSFDNIILRGGFTDSWPTRYSDSSIVAGSTWRGQRYRPESALIMRDPWVKDTQRDMGGWLAAYSDYVHVYLNGFYWGVYNNSERLDGAMISSHLGGLEEDWDLIVYDDTIGAVAATDGNMNDWNAMMSLVNAGVTSEASYQAVGQIVDVENLIDYMMLHIFAEAEDWPNHNWYAAHRRATNSLPATKWIFLTWDQDITIDPLVRRNQINVSNDNTPARVYSQLRAWPEFRRQFGDRIQKHFFNGGALTPSNNVARMMARAARLDRAIVGESARWGDAREFATPGNPATGVTFTREEWWLPELQKVCTNLFQVLNFTNLARFRAGNLYPGLDAPGFNQFGGNVPAGFSLVITNPNASGTIYFTLDGNDPRVYGTGTIAPTAQAYASPVLINSPVIARARVRDGTNWSALVEASFAPPQDLSKLALTEIMYNPPALGPIAGNDLEFLELKNVGTNVLDLSGLTFSSGITFTFTNGTLLAPGQFCVLARNGGAFATKYPGVSLRGAFAGQLDNGGETLTLSYPTTGNIFSLTYDDVGPWPVTPDGFGFSLVPKQPGVSQAPDNGASWRASRSPGGSPGADDSSPNIAPVVISEILTHTDPPQKDAIELYNPAGTNADVSGWYLTDSAGSPMKFRIPNGTIIPAGGRVFFDESQFNAGTNGNVAFLFSSTGEEVYLFSATNAQLTGYSHGFAFGPCFNGVGLERYVNSVGEEFYPLEISLTLGLPNSGPRIGPIVFNEIHYHPATNEDEFIELLNNSAGSVPLFDPANPTNTWKVGGLGYTFPTNITLSPGELLLLVATNPPDFRAKYGVAPAVKILGPVSGALQNDGERLTLDAPDSPNLGVAPYVTVEEVRYNDKAPWPPDADGGGPSLQRISPLVFGNEPTNWLAAPPSPGVLFADADSDGDGLPNGWEIAHGTDWRTPDADADPDGDGLSNLQEFLVGTDPNDPASTLKLDALATNPGVVTLQFLAVSNRTYSVLYKDFLAAPLWTKLSDVPARGTNHVENVMDSTGTLTNRFYRLVTPQWP